MHELKVASYPELHAWSARHRAEFWDIMIQRLGIRFRQNYEKIVDLSQGVESPQWLVGSRLNIAESCFQAPEDAPAIVFQQEEGLLLTLTYGELHALTNQVANGLVNAGFHPGDAIAIDMPMRAESIAIYLGIVKAGCVVVAIADSFATAKLQRDCACLRQRQSLPRTTSAVLASNYPSMPKSLMLTRLELLC